jgi:mono/diheme cytochrome c family protein
MRLEASMRSVSKLIVIAIVLALGSVAAWASTQSQTPWAQCCGVGPWPIGEGMRWRANSSMPRHHMAMVWGIPVPYGALTNPLPKKRTTIERGAKVYAAHCAGCHGPTGQGDGPAGRGLSPPPGNLAWLAQMPMARQDSFMIWTIAEGGEAFGTAMPAFKDSLSKDEMWAVTAYIQARLPQKPR